MRGLLVIGLLLTVLFSGCTQGTPDAGSDWQATCPSWTLTKSKFLARGEGWFHPAGTNTDAKDTVGGGLTAYGGKPLDLIELLFETRDIELRDTETNETFNYTLPALRVENGILQAQFFRNDTGEAIEATDASRGAPGPNNPGQTVLTWEPGIYANFTLRLFLAPSDEPARPGTVDIIWTLLGPRPGPEGSDQSAWAERGQMTATYWYRTCNRDGSTATANV